MHQTQWSAERPLPPPVSAVGQVVLAADVANLLCLHGFELGAVGDPMAQAPTEGTATLSCGNGVPG